LQITQYGGNLKSTQARPDNCDGLLRHRNLPPNTIPPTMLDRTMAGKHLPKDSAVLT
jgi:hypothetical protein